MYITDKTQSRVEN